jgi:geranylgeranyl diphosphate synthase type I
MRDVDHSASGPWHTGIGESIDGVSTMSFANLLQDVRTRVDADLAKWLAPKVIGAAAISAPVGHAAEAVRDLSLRGGKRMRAALVAVGYEAYATPGSSWEICVPAMVANELLQTYLLIHDDWMDDDDTRRGGPSTHVVLRKQWDNRALGDAGAILAGDLACGWAQEALLQSEVAPERVLRAARAFARIQSTVVCGQIAEMTADPDALTPSVETVHDLKTSSYTVTGPLLVGAALAGGMDEQALTRFGRPLGVAFQLRDDLLGTFGDPSVTGKPIWNDVRQRKRTGLVAELLRDASGLEVWKRGEVEPIVRAMESGAKARVEARVTELLAEARTALAAMTTITEAGRIHLEGAVSALGERAS